MLKSSPLLKTGSDLQQTEMEAEKRGSKKRRSRQWLQKDSATLNNVEIFKKLVKTFA